MKRNFPCYKIICTKYIDSRKRSLSLYAKEDLAVVSDGCGEGKDGKEGQEGSVEDVRGSPSSSLDDSNQQKYGTKSVWSW